MISRKSSQLNGRDVLLCAELRKMAATLPAGSVLPSILELKKKFNVGQTVLKRVIHVLQEEGWVAVRDGKGTFVMDRRHPLNTSEEAMSVNFHVPWISTTSGELVLAIPAAQPEGQILKEVAELYNAQTPHAKVVLKSVSGVKQLTEIRTRDSIDLFIVRSIIEKHEFPDPGFFLDLSPFLAESPPSLPVYDCVWEKDAQTGALQGLAIFLVTTQLAYHKEAFRNLRLHWSDQPTWAELLEKSGRLQKSYGQSKSFAFLGYMPFFYRWGIHLVEKANSWRIKIDPAELDPLLRYLHELIVEKQVAPFWLSARNQLYNRTDGCKNYAMMEVASCFDLADQEDIGFISLPRTVSGADLIHYPLLCARATTPHAEECWDFIRFFLSESGQQVVSRYNLGLPPARDIIPRNVSGERLKAMQTAVHTGTTVYCDSVAPYRVKHIIEKQIEKYLKLGGATTALVQEIETLANVLLGRKTNTQIS